MRRRPFFSLWRRRSATPSAGPHLTPEQLLAFMDGELPAKEASDCRDHLAACWTCRTEQSRLSDTIECVVACRARQLEGQVPPATGPRARLLAELARRRDAAPDGSRRPAMVRPLNGWRPLAVLAATTAVIVAAAIATVLIWRSSVLLSASEVMRRADDRIAELIAPGSVFYRRWNVSNVVEAPGKPPEATRQVYEEWAEDSIPVRLASRTYAEDGRLLDATWALTENGVRRLYHFNAGGTPATYRWPSRKEVEAVLTRYDPQERRTLLFAFEFAGMEPVVKEHRFPDEATRLASVFETEKTTLDDGRAGRVVTLVLPRAPVMDVTGGRFSAVGGAWQATYVYDADSYLLQSARGELLLRDGLRRRYQMRVERCEVIPVEAAGDVFSFTPPEGAPSFSLGAEEMMRELHRVLFP